MHKIFANPLFLGKKVVFLPQCHSTNEEMLQMVRKQAEPEGLIIHTDQQLTGKGQRGNLWVSEAGKNVLMSLLLRPKFLAPASSFHLNLMTALAISDAIESLSGLECQIKWPNDIYVNNRKCAGILIESNISKGAVEFAVIGVGLNVNQDDFSKIEATSLLLECGRQLDRWELMESMLTHMEKWYRKLKTELLSDILKAYYSRLRWLEEERIFSDDHGEFAGAITGITESGFLRINTKEGERTFDVKEVRFVR